jgi:drug/metabolite transporter (DMT)-like permease
MSNERSVRGWRRWVPVIWCLYVGAYVVVFLVRGQVVPAVVAAVLAVLVGLGLAAELRRPDAARPRLFGWEQDERQRLIHERAMTLVGYAAVAAVAVAGFTAFVLGREDVAIWPSTALLGLAAVYGIGLAFYQRRA